MITLMLPLVCNFVPLHFLVYLNLYVIPETSIMRIKGPPEECCLLSKVNALNMDKQAD
jgi:hypothetical protein